jgi:hypothetical protein
VLLSSVSVERLPLSRMVVAAPSQWVYFAKEASAVLPTCYDPNYYSVTLSPGWILLENLTGKEDVPGRDRTAGPYH